jgi:drug/metabolite transporter (DMT)-like permease
VLATGVLLLLFTVTTFTAIRHASVSTVLAIGTAAPVITTLVQVARSRHVDLDLPGLAGLGMTLAAMIAVLSIGLRHDSAELSSARA